MARSPKPVNVLALGELVVSIVAAGIIVALVGKIPGTEGRMPYVPVNAFVFLVLLLVCLMLWKLVDSLKHSKKTLVALVLTIFAYSSTIYFIAVDMAEVVVFNTQILSYLAILICMIAGLPFVVEQPIICFRQTTAKRDSICFAATVMWLSPLIAEVAILFKWYFRGDLWNRLGYMVLGGKGIADILFFYGFWAFLAMTLFHLLECARAKSFVQVRTMQYPRKKER